MSGKQISDHALATVPAAVKPEVAGGFDRRMEIDDIVTRFMEIDRRYSDST